MWTALKKHRLFTLFIGILAAIALVPVLYYGFYKVYRVVDKMRFPEASSYVLTLDSKWDEKKKGSALAHVITLQLRREMGSTFGWSVNDLYISPTRYLDRRNNRQLGVIFATRLLIEFFSTDLAKYGMRDDENDDLKKARMQCFNYTEYKWWFVSTEKRYREGLELVEKYRKDLADGKAMYNMRTDDLYNVLVLINSGKFLDQPLGKLIQTSEEIPYRKLDDQVYYAQGVVLVLRDFLKAVVQMYPEVTHKGGKENIREAFRDMDKICTFDPVIVLRGHHDSLFADHRGKLARYMTNVSARINDLAQSIRR